MEIHLEFENFGDEKKLSDRFSLYVTFFFYDALNPLNIDRKTKKQWKRDVTRVDEIWSFESSSP